MATSKTLASVPTTTDMTGKQLLMIDTGSGSVNRLNATSVVRARLIRGTDVDADTLDAANTLYEVATGSNTFTNLPEAAALSSSFRVLVLGSGGYIMQVFSNYGSEATLWLRSRIYSSTSDAHTKWGTWVRLVRATELDALASRVAALEAKTASL